MTVDEEFDALHSGRFCDTCDEELGPWMEGPTCDACAYSEKADRRIEADRGN